MPEQKTLQIKKPSHLISSKTLCKIAVVAFILIALPLTTVDYFHTSSRLLYGDVTKDLMQDVSASYSAPTPFPSSWQDHHLLLSGHSEYRGSPSSNLNILETYIALFDWRSFLISFFYLNFCLAQTGSYNLGIQVTEIKSHCIGWLLFLLFAACYSILLLLAVDGSINLVYDLTQDLARWLEKSIVYVNPEEMSMNVYETQISHPFTLGLVNPYFLQEKFRYVGEDVHFECEYKILGETRAKPIFASSWWAKDGIPVVTDDRQFVNVTIIPTTNIAQFFMIGMRYFTIRNTLTIHMVKPSDYGFYTCIYLDPMLTIVEPIFKQYEHTQKVPLTPMSPQPDCGCKPSASVLRVEKSLVNEFDISQCFAEFELKPRRPVKLDINVDVPIGGILVTSFNYITLAEMSDVSVVDTFPDHSSTECCSPIIKLYWIFFKGGCFVDLPLSRAGWSNHSTTAFNFGKSMCVCKDSPTRHQAKIYRDVFNSTLNDWETVDIDHPISLMLNAPNNGTAPFMDSMYFCDEPAAQLCYLLDIILENRFYTLYGVDLLIIFIAILKCLSVFIFHILIKKYLSIPFRKICLLDPPILFKAVNGPHIKISYSTIEEDAKFRSNICYESDIFFTYCHDNSFDRAVAEVFKTALEESAIKIFDPYRDILPGTLTLNETHAAIHRSARFVVLVSAAFQDDHTKQYEFGSINDTIESQGPNAKSRLLVVRLGQCDINGLHCVPCISIPNTERENFQLDEHYIYRLKEWEKATRPVDKRANRYSRICADLKLYGFHWMSVVCFGLLLVLARYSFLFAPDKDILQDSEAAETA